MLSSVFGKSGKSWKVDHSYDDFVYNDAEAGEEDISTISGGSKPPSYSQDPSLILETAREKKLRKRSHWVAYATMFVMTAGFSVVLSGVWPYLQLLDESLTKSAVGWVVAANPLGQMIASPVLGYMGNRLGSIRVICYFTMSSFIVGNLIYSFLPLMTDWWPHSAYHMMIISRFIVGLSSANVTLCRSYLAASTTTKERTTGIAFVSAAQSLGFVIGPAVQTVFSLSISNEFMKYRSTALFAVFLGVVNFVLLTPCIFTEYNIAKKEDFLTRSTLNTASGAVEGKLPKPDLRNVIGILTSYFFTMLIFIFMETLSVPLLTDQYAWENVVAVIVVGVMTIATGVLALLMIVVLRLLIKRFDERKILLLLGYMPIAIGTFLYIPLYTDTPITMSNCTTVYTKFSFSDFENVQSSLHNLQLFSLSPNPNDRIDINPFFNYILKNAEYSSPNGTTQQCTPGCPEIQDWCHKVPRIPLAQFVCANILIILGLPIATALTLALYSKIIGPRPQGLWMALLAEILSLARVLGPIMSSYLYTTSGTIEYNIAEKERSLLKNLSVSGDENYKLPRPDYVAIVGILFGFFCNQFVYVLLETLMEPFVADQYAWCADKAVVIVGVAFAISGIIAIGMFITATRLAKRYDERKILIFMAFVPIAVGCFLFFPWGPRDLKYCPDPTYSSTMSMITSTDPSITAKLYDKGIYYLGTEHNDFHPPNLYMVYDSAQQNSNSSSTSKWCPDDECYGCPVEQTWCIGYPQLPLAQFFVAYLIVISGYPFGVSMSNAIYSKMLGPKPQGLWMGILTSSGSLARVTGPIFVAQIYSKVGTRWTFGILFLAMLLAMTELTILFKRIVPMKVPKIGESNNKDKQDGPQKRRI